MKLRVAGAQIPVTPDVEANIATLSRAIDFARDEKADILLTPEGSLSGYTYEFDAAQVEDGLRRVRAMAMEARIGLALGTCFVETDDGKVYNQIRFYDASGHYLGFHSKTLNIGTLTDPPEGEVAHFAVRPLRLYPYQDVPVAGLICNDMWANPSVTPMPDPHLTQQLATMGARIIFHAVNGGRDGSDWSDVAWQFHETNLRMRALAGRVWIVTVDNCEPIHLRCSAPSGVIDPGGNWVCRTAPVGVDYFAYTIDLDDMST